MKKIFKDNLSVIEARELISEGYKYSVDCDFVTSDGTDPWSGMPIVNNNIAVFMTEAEAKAFAAKVVGPFNSATHGIVKVLCWGETNTEMDARLEREKKERKAKREAKEAEKAAAAGMTVAEYKATKAKAVTKRRLENEIAELEKEIAARRAKLAKMDA